MAFKKKTWSDRMVEYAGRRKLTNVSTKQAIICDVERSEGTVSKEGDAFSSQNMNDLEQRVADGFSEVKQTTDGLIQNLGGCRFGITADGQPGYKKAGADTVYPFRSGTTIPMTIYAATAPTDNGKAWSRGGVEISGDIFSEVSLDTIGPDRCFVDNIEYYSPATISLDAGKNHSIHVFRTWSNREISTTAQITLKFR